MILKEFLEKLVDECEQVRLFTNNDYELFDSEINIERNGHKYSACYGGETSFCFDMLRDEKWHEHCYCNVLKVTTIQGKRENVINILLGEESEE